MRPAVPVYWRCMPHIDDQHRILVVQLLDDELADVVADRVGVSPGLRQQMLQAVRGSVPRVLGERPAILARQVRQQPEDQCPRPAARFHTANRRAIRSIRTSNMVPRPARISKITIQAGAPTLELIPPMDMSSREIRIPLAEAVAVLQDLNEFVVSLDRLGSRQASGTADEHTVGTFIDDWDVARRLARVRHVISVALDEQLSKEDNLEIDALCEQGRFYTDNVGNPSPDQSS